MAGEFLARAKWHARGREQGALTGFATVDSPCETRNEIKIILSISSKTLSSHPVPVRRSAPVPPAAAVLSAAPTVVDVARLAGVALGTVSRVLNIPESVRPEVRQRVLEAIAAMNYRRLRQRRPVARPQPRTRRKRGVVGILLLGFDESLAQLPVVADALHGVELAAAAEGFNLMFANVPAADRVPRFLAPRQVDGVIVKCPVDGDFSAFAAPDLVQALAAVPHVWLAGCPDGATGDECGADADAVACLAAEALHRRGHRRVAQLSYADGLARIEPLKLGFALHAQRLGMHVQTLETSVLAPCAWPRSTRPAAAVVVAWLERWLALPERGRPTALVVPSDRVAAELYAGLAARGLRPGRDVSVLSLTHEKSLAAGLEPRVTGIDSRAGTIGRRAVERLLWRIDHPADREATKVVVAPLMIEGASVAELAV